MNIFQLKMQRKEQNVLAVVKLFVWMSIAVDRCTIIRFVVKVNTVHFLSLIAGYEVQPERLFCFWKVC